MASKKIISQTRPFLAKNLFNKATISPLLARTYFNRDYSSKPEAEQPKKGNAFVTVGVLAAGAAGAYYFLSSPTEAKEKVSAATKAVYKSKEYYQKVYDHIAERLEENPDYDDGSYGPVLVRLAWHAAGTYDKKLNNGGIVGATMRFEEGKHGGNAGLHVARDFMEKVKKVFPDITYSDLWTLGGVCAIQEMGGPIIPWRPGRSDDKPESERPAEGRLPDASQGHQHVRDVFYRMGFNDKEIVTLLGAHALGRCHTDRSGYKGPWTFSPTQFTNDFYVKLLEEKWQVKKWNGPKQYEDAATKSLMMLPTDMAFLWDKEFLKHVKVYAADEQLFFKDFSDVFSRLMELGFVFTKDNPVYTFKPTV